MRPIIFRAKRTGSGVNAGKWVHGSLIHSLNGVFMYGYQARCQVPVDPATIGQFTGLTDKNGKEIYEGDIIRHKDMVKPYYVIYDGHQFTPNDGFRSLSYPKHWEVIGNIHDNPELLEINKRTND